MPRQQKPAAGKKMGSGKTTAKATAKATATKTATKAIAKTTTKAAAKAKPVKAKASVGMTVQEAGKRGGEAVKKKYGPEFYSQIGQKGGEKIQAEAKRFRELKELGKVR